MGVKHPTAKQVATLQLLSQNPEMSTTQAMLKAGYSKTTARNPKQKLLKSETTISIIDNMRLELNQAGVTTQYLAQKLAQFAYSENSKIFFGAYDRIAKIVGIEAQKQTEQPTRRFTFEEWVSDDNQKANPIEEQKDSELKSLMAMDAIELDRHGEAVYSPPNPPVVIEADLNEETHRQPIISNTPPFKEQAKHLEGFIEDLGVIPERGGE